MNAILAYNQREAARALDDMELATPVGQWCQVEMAVRGVPSQALRDQVRQAVLNGGHNISPIDVSMVDGQPVVSFKLQRQEPYAQYQWQFLLPLLMVLAIGGFSVFGILQLKEITPSILEIILVLGGVGVALLALWKRPGPNPSLPFGKK